MHKNPIAMPFRLSKQPVIAQCPITPVSLRLLGLLGYIHLKKQKSTGEEHNICYSTWHLVFS